ncbi:hypothetical protein RB595_002715 [Gaeumannomyces hyphopodioides]
MADLSSAAWSETPFQPSRKTWMTIIRSFESDSDPSDPYPDQLSDDECAIASRSTPREETGTTTRSSSPCGEIVSYKDMEPIHYRLLEGTYLSSLEFSLSQIPHGDSVSFLLRPELCPKNQAKSQHQRNPENETDLELSDKEHSEDCQIDGASAAAGVKPTGGDSAKAKDNAPETAEIQVTGNGRVNAGESNTIEGDPEDKRDNAAQDRKDCDQDGHGTQLAQRSRDLEFEPDQAVDKKDGDIGTAENGDERKTPEDAGSDVASIIDAETASVTDTDAASIINTTPGDTTIEEMEVAQNGEEGEHETNTSQIDLPLVAPVNQQFEVRSASMGGSGAFARKDLKLHDVILVEKYILTGNGFTIRKQFAALDALAQRVYLCLHPHWPSDEQPTEILTAICHTNSFCIPGSKAVFPVASRFNHKCQSKCNLTYHYDSQSELLVFCVAVDHISAGDELTISYGGSPQTLYQRYGFFCSCGGCDGYTQAKADALSLRNWI